MLAWTAIALAGPAWTARYDTHLNGPFVSVQAEFPTRTTDLWVSVGAGRLAGMPSLGAAAGLDARVLSVPIGIGTHGRFEELGGVFGWRVGLYADLPGAWVGGSRFVEAARLRGGDPALATGLAVVVMPLQAEARVRVFPTERVAISGGAHLRYASLGLTLAEDAQGFWGPLLTPSVGLELRFGEGPR